jgi:integrase
VVDHLRPETIGGRRPDTHRDQRTSRPQLHPETAKPLDRSKLVRRFKQALDRAGVHRITFHELRHTFGTRMAAAGTPMRTLQHWMGHADSKTTQIYAHYQPSDHEADAVDRAFSQ